MNGAVLANSRASVAYRLFATEAYPAVRSIVEKVIASGLIYLPSHARDFKNPEIDKYLQKYVRGSSGIDYKARIKVMKLLWDAIGSEFGARHELYEMNYAGSHELVRLFPLQHAQGSGSLKEMEALVEQCMADYDEDGWNGFRLLERRGRLGVGTAQVELPTRSAILASAGRRSVPLGRCNIGARARKSAGLCPSRREGAPEGNGGGLYVVSGDVQMCNRTDHAAIGGAHAHAILRQSGDDLLRLAPAWARVEEDDVAFDLWIHDADAGETADHLRQAPGVGMVFS